MSTGQVTKPKIPENKETVQVGVKQKRIIMGSDTQCNIQNFTEGIVSDMGTNF